MQKFRVEELATEPAAYAAAALPALGVQPTTQGIAYAVFDFGGGTTDFDFGIWRSATTEEEDEGYESVFEHLESSGDNYLGGEQLLEHLAYRIFCENIDALRAKRIHFTLPADAEIVPGSETFLQPTQAAQTNMVILISRLRPFWEGNSDTLQEEMKLDLLDANGQIQAVELVTKREKLESFLQDRIQRGVDLFLCELARVFSRSEYRRDTQHILLGGNASRSRYVRSAFDPNSGLWQEETQRLFGGAVPQITIHEPLEIDPERPYAPTAKTGVALGLLKLVPGNGIKVIDRIHTARENETPFRFFFGRVRGGVLEYRLSPETAYGEWLEVGPITGGFFNAYFTHSPRARSGMAQDDGELTVHRIAFAEASNGDRLWARAVSPDTVEVCCVAKNAEPNDALPTQTIVLRTK